MILLLIMSKNFRKCVICKTRESKSDKKIFFTSFPSNETRCKEWLKVVGIAELVHLPIEKLSRTRFICENHFEAKVFNKKKSQLKKTAIPKLNLIMPPLSDAQLVEFPQHMASYKKITPADRPSTSRASQSSLLVNQEITPADRPSTSRASQSSLLVNQEITPADRPSTSRASQSSLLVNQEKTQAVRPSTSQASQSSLLVNQEITPAERPSTSRASQSSLLVNQETSPRKKKLLNQLKKTKLTLKSLKKSAALIENIESPVLRDIVISSCKNQRRKSAGRRWTTKDKVTSLAIFKRSPKTYRYLRNIIPLPSVRTLQIVLKQVPMEPGINKSVLEHLAASGQNKTDKEKVCALLFDEIALKTRLIYNQTTDKVDGFQDFGSSRDEERTDELANHALVFMLQGIYKKFKQPLAFYFVKGTISSDKLAVLIKEIINAVSASGYRILTTVCDQGPTNMGALKILKSSATDHSFFVADQEIFIIYDVPHLFKSIRNNFFNNKRMVLDGNTANWAHLVKVEEKNRNFLYLSKIGQTHVAPKYRAKMKVKLAAQVLSNTVSAVLKLLSEAEKNESMSLELMSTALVVQDLDRLFDCTNGPSCPEDIKKGFRENVSKNTKHVEEWTKYTQKLQTMQFINADGKVAGNVKCIQGYITTLKSLRAIWMSVHKLGFRYLNLRQLNQDALENLFGVIRQHSPTNTNPTCSHFMTALKTAVVTGLTAPQSRGSNCNKDSNTLMTNFHNIVFDKKNSGQENQDIKETALISEDSNASKDDLPVISLPDEDIEIEDNLTQLSEQPVVYVSGYLAYQILKTHQCKKCRSSLTVVDPDKLNDPTYNYISLREWWINKKSLTYPSKQLCFFVQGATALMESEICPVIHRSNICQMAITIFMTNCDTSWFGCASHKNIIFRKMLSSLGQLLIRRQCQIINQRMALQEENLADSVKKAQQQGKAK